MTNPDAELILDGEVFHLAPGGIVHFVNHGCVHAARNLGTEPRVHLVCDLFLTRDAYDATFGDAAGSSLSTRVGDDDRDRPCRTTERMGSYLRLPPQVDPNEAERALEHEQARWMLLARRTHVVQKDGIHHDRDVYFADELWGMVG